MSKSHMTVTVVLTMLFLAIVGFCVWSAIEGGSTEMILGGAIITLGLAQLLSFTARDQTLTSAMRRVSDIMGAYGALSRELHAVTRRISTIEGYGMIEHADARSPSREWMQRSLERSRRAIEPAPAPARAALQSSAHSANSPAYPSVHRVPDNGSAHQFEEERFDLYLEPIV